MYLVVFRDLSGPGYLVTATSHLRAARTAGLGEEAEDDSVVDVYRAFPRHRGVIAFEENPTTFRSVPRMPEVVEVPR